MHTRKKVTSGWRSGREEIGYVLCWDFTSFHLLELSCGLFLIPNILIRMVLQSKLLIRLLYLLLSRITTHTKDIVIVLTHFIVVEYQ